MKVVLSIISGILVLLLAVSITSGSPEHPEPIFTLLNHPPETPQSDLLTLWERVNIPVSSPTPDPGTLLNPSPLVPVVYPASPQVSLPNVIPPAEEQKAPKSSLNIVSGTVAYKVMDQGKAITMQGTVTGTINPVTGDLELSSDDVILKYSGKSYPVIMDVQAAYNTRYQYT